MISKSVYKQRSFGRCCERDPRTFILSVHLIEQKPYSLLIQTENVPLSTRFANFFDQSIPEFKYPQKFSDRTDCKQGIESNTCADSFDSRNLWSPTDDRCFWIAFSCHKSTSRRLLTKCAATKHQYREETEIHFAYKCHAVLWDRTASYSCTALSIVVTKCLNTWTEEMRRTLSTKSRKLKSNDGKKEVELRWVKWRQRRGCPDAARIWNLNILQQQRFRYLLLIIVLLRHGNWTFHPRDVSALVWTINPLNGE